PGGAGIKEVASSLGEPPLIAPVGVHHKKIIGIHEVWCRYASDERDLFAVRRPRGAVVQLVRPTTPRRTVRLRTKKLGRGQLRPTAAVRVHDGDARMIIKVMTEDAEGNLSVCAKRHLGVSCRPARS